MKARVKTTGEIVEVVKDGPFYNAIDGYERYYEHELDFNDTIDYWTRLEHQYAGMAMQGLVANQSIVYGQDFDEALDEHITVNAVAIAHALVEKLKEKEERK